jgi:hypothetical protein
MVPRCTADVPLEPLSPSVLGRAVKAVLAAPTGSATATLVDSVLSGDEPRVTFAGAMTALTSAGLRMSTCVKYHVRKAIVRPAYSAVHVLQQGPLHAQLEVTPLHPLFRDSASHPVVIVNGIERARPELVMTPGSHSHATYAPCAVTLTDLAPGTVYEVGVTSVGNLETGGQLDSTFDVQTQPPPAPEILVASESIDGFIHDQLLVRVTAGPGHSVVLEVDGEVRRYPERRDSQGKVSLCLNGLTSDRHSLRYCCRMPDRSAASASDTTAAWSPTIVVSQETMESYLERGQPWLHQSWQLLRATLDVVSEFHARGAVHGAISIGNVVVHRTFVGKNQVAQMPVRIPSCPGTPPRVFLPSVLDISGHLSCVIRINTAQILAAPRPRTCSTLVSCWLTPFCGWFGLGRLWPRTPTGHRKVCSRNYMQQVCFDLDPASDLPCSAACVRLLPTPNLADHLFVLVVLAVHVAKMIWPELVPLLEGCTDVDVTKRLDALSALDRLMGSEPLELCRSCLKPYDNRTLCRSLTPCSHTSCIDCFDGLPNCCVCGEPHDGRSKPVQEWTGHNRDVVNRRLRPWTQLDLSAYTLHHLRLVLLGFIGGGKSTTGCKLLSFDPSVW